MASYDAIVMGTPVYWYHVSAQFKMLVDRLYCFFEFGENPDTGEQTIHSAFPGGKNFLFIISRGDPEPPKLFPQFYDHLNEWLNLIPLSLGAAKYEYFHQYDTGIDRKSAKNDPEILGKAKAVGAGFLSTTSPSKH
jgi:multimeric flavodoxin WrbA